MLEQANPFIKKLPVPKAVYHASRVSELVDGVLFDSGNSKIRDLPEANGDVSRGPGIYFTELESARKYRARRSESNPNASIFKIDVGGKYLFDMILLRGLFSIVNGETKLSGMLKSNHSKVSQYAELIKAQLQIIVSDFITYLENNNEIWLAKIPAGVRKSTRKVIEKIVTDNQRELQKSKVGQNFILPYFAMNENDDLHTKKAVYYFGKFLSEATLLDGLMDIERPDWNTHLPLEEKRKSRVYVLFDRSKNGITAQKLNGID